VQPRFTACAPSWGVIAAVAIATLAAPAAASGATLAVVNPKPCFGAGDTIGLGGAGWQPGADISFTRDNTRLQSDVVANAAGRFLTNTVAPSIRAKRTSAFYSATDDVSGVAATPVRLSRLGVSIRPQRANPTDARRISARGFTFRNRRFLYSHRVRDGRSHNELVGRLRGQCKTASRRTPILRGARPGRYRLQFDAFRGYSANRRQRVVFRVRVVRSAVGSAAAVAGNGGGTAIASIKRID
jgi:hypothetical protein